MSSREGGWRVYTLDQRRVGISLGSGALLKELLLLEHLESPLETASSMETVFIACPYQYSDTYPKS